MEFKPIVLSQQSPFRSDIQKQKIIKRPFICLCYLNKSQLDMYNDKEMASSLLIFNWKVFWNQSFPISQSKSPLRPLQTRCYNQSSNIYIPSLCYTRCQDRISGCFFGLFWLFFQHRVLGNIYIYHIFLICHISPGWQYPFFSKFSWSIV